MQCLLTVCFSLLLGGSHESIPPDGTWWETPQPVSWHQDAFAWGVGISGQDWSLQAEQLGKMTSAAVACAENEPACTQGLPYAHWYGGEHPRGLWAIYEPQVYHGLFGQVGIGAVWPNFNMVIPDWNATLPAHLLVVGNNHVIPSPLVGLGYRLGHIDMTLNYRLVRTTNNGEDFQGFGWSIFELAVRTRF